MNRTQKSGPGSSVRSRDSATWTPRIRARWSARSRWRPSKVRDVAALLSIRELEIVVRHHPRVAAAAALRAVDHERSGLERDPGQAARRDIDLGAGEDEGTQVLVASAQLAAIEDRLHRQRDDGLGDEGARVGDDAAAKLLALGFGRGRADEHPVTAGRVDGLDHQAVEVLEHVAAVGV